MDSRTKNSSRNMVFACLAYLVQVILSFLLRRYFIYVFNEEYLGLNSLFTNVLSLLSLAELGFGTALVFEMYKPMAEGDKEKVRQLLHFYKVSYSIIGVVIGVLGLCVLPFMGYFKAQAPGVDLNLYIVYLISLTNTVVSYFFAYRRSLLYASQRNDIESKVNTIFNIVTTLLQLSVLFVFGNYYLYAGVSIITGVASNLSIYLITQKKYSEYVRPASSNLDKETKKEINKNIRALVTHRIGGVVLTGTDSLIIFLMLGASTLGKYSNYLLITTQVGSLISIFTNSVRSSIGNSIAGEGHDKNYKLFTKLNFLQFWLVSFCAVCIFVLADPFIDVMLTKGGETSLTLNTQVLLLMCISFYITHSRTVVQLFKDGAGLFYQDRIKPIIESIANLILSIVLTNLIGLPGVIIGTIVSTVTVCLWVEPHVLNKYYMKRSTVKYFGKYFLFAFATLISGAVTYFMCGLIQTDTLLTLIAKFAICAVVPNLMLLLCLWWTPEFKECVKWGIEILHNFKHKKAPASEGNIDVVVTGVDIDKDGVDDITTMRVFKDGLIIEPGLEPIEGTTMQTANSSRAEDGLSNDADGELEEADNPSTEEQPS